MSVTEQDARPESRPPAVWGLVVCGVLSIALAVGLALVPRGGPAGAPELRFTDGYVPKPASPDVAAAYVVIHNDGPVTDRLVGVSTPQAETATLHEEVMHGATEEMVALGPVTVPAHGAVTLAPGGVHVMLVRPRGLVVGASVRLTFTFAVSGPVTVVLPVRGLDAVPPG